jgi:hypothetical protein
MILMYNLYCVYIKYVRSWICLKGYLKLFYLLFFKFLIIKKVIITCVFYLGFLS